MKTERELAELIFDKFRSTQCKTGQMIMERNVRFGVIDKLNPVEKELSFIVLNGLIHTGYITYQADSPQCFFLTEKGYDYIYDDEKVAAMHEIPWIFPSLDKTDWDKAYFKLWKVIGPQESAPFYIGGTQFYKFIMELCDDIPPSYSEYIELRKKKDISTSRVKYYKDLIDHLPEDRRVSLYAAIQIHIEITINITKDADEFEVGSNWDEPEVKPEKEVFDSVKVQEIKIEKPINMPKEEEQPKVFISYSWDGEEHEKWVVALAEKLCENGVNIILDKWDLGPLGKPLPNFMEQSIVKSKRVICIMTANYKKKTDKSKGGVGYEYSIISAEIFTKGVNTSKFIPLLRQGTDANAIPTVLVGRKYVDMRVDAQFESKFKDELLRDIHNEPKYKKPLIGPKPKFD